MTDRSQWTLFFGMATFFIVAATAILLLLRRQRSDTEVILDAIDGARNEIDSNAKHTVLEHESLSKEMRKANGRLQFLMAKEIAEELGEIASAIATPAKATETQAARPPENRK